MPNIDKTRRLREYEKEIDRLREALRAAPMPIRESTLDEDEWDEAYDKWWHEHASERNLMMDETQVVPEQEWREVESSNVDAIAYYGGSLYVRFNNGNIYKYDDHPENEGVTAESLHLALVTAATDHGSVGSVFNRVVRMAGVPTTKIEVAHAD